MPKLFEVRQSQKLCPDCRKENMRVVDTTTLEEEVVKQWTCPGCHFRITKVNVAATKRYRETGKV